MADSVGIHCFQKAASKIAAAEVVVVDDGVAVVEAVGDDYEVIMILVVLGQNNLSSFGNYCQSAYCNVLLS